MTVEAGTIEGARCGIGTGIQPALDIGCDGVVITGVCAVQPACDAGGVSADLIGGAGRAETRLFELNLKCRAEVALLRLWLKVCDITYSRFSSGVGPPCGCRLPTPAGSFGTQTKAPSAR